jgi:sugar/nucleoside kinase (ribokinase family)
MIHLQANAGRNALHATMCSFLGLTARDLAEIGDFSERFARDLLAGRRPFPADTQHALEQLLGDWDSITKAFILDVKDGVRTSYVYRTNEQLRASPVGKVWRARGKAAGGFVGPYRAAIFAAWRAAQSKGINVEMIFASTPEVGE